MGIFLWPHYRPGPSCINCIKTNKQTKRIQTKQNKDLSIYKQHFSVNRLGKIGDMLTFPLRGSKQRNDGKKHTGGRRKKEGIGKESWTLHM